MQVDVSHSVCYNTALNFLKNRMDFKLGDKLLQVFKYGFLRFFRPDEAMFENW